MTDRITIFGAKPTDLTWIATAIGIAENERPRSNSEVVVSNRSLGNKALVKFTRAGVSVRFEQGDLTCASEKLKKIRRRPRHPRRDQGGDR